MIGARLDRAAFAAQRTAESILNRVVEHAVDRIMTHDEAIGRLAERAGAAAVERAFILLAPHIDDDFILAVVDRVADRVADSTLSIFGVK